RLRTALWKWTFPGSGNRQKIRRDKGMFMLNWFQIQSRTTTLSYQGIRAFYVDRSGLEWGKNYPEQRRLLQCDNLLASEQV
ncbi:MAG: hypothetical protein V5B78_04505, partial [Desulfohalobiaceae bacterium]